MKMDGYIRNWTKILKESEEVNEVSDVDVDWNDDELKKVSDRKSQERYMDMVNFRDIKDNEKAEMLDALLKDVTDLCWYERDSQYVNNMLKDIKDGGTYWWKNIPEKNRKLLYSILTSVHQYDADDNNTEEIRKSREEN